MADEPNTVAASTGLSDDAASGLAYLTFIPAIIFLVVAPYSTNPKVKFHAWQSIFLAVTWFAAWVVLMVLAFVPFVGWILLPIHLLLFLGLFIVWLIAIIQAFQGKRFSIPVIGSIAAKQAGA
ncbi:MAG: DUF4870 domain-containing protein [Terracidiphilus sp.]